MAEMPVSSARKQRQDESQSKECFDTLGEAHEENAYGAMQRLIQAGEQVGFTVHDLIRMLESGMTLESMLEVIEARMMGSCVHLNLGPRK